MEKVMMDKLNGCIFWLKMMTWLEKYNTSWDKASAAIKKEFYSEPVYNKTFLKTKIKPHGDKVTDFYCKEIPVDSKS